MFQGIEIWQMSLALVGTVVLFILLFFSAMARFLKRPSPSEAIIRIGRVTTDVFIGRACWIVPVLHRATTHVAVDHRPDHPRARRTTRWCRRTSSRPTCRPSSTSASSPTRTT